MSLSALRDLTVLSWIISWIWEPLCGDVREGKWEDVRGKERDGRRQSPKWISGYCFVFWKHQQWKRHWFYQRRSVSLKAVSDFRSRVLARKTGVEFMATVSGACVRDLVLPSRTQLFLCLLVSIWLFLSISSCHFVVFASQSMSCFGNLPSSIHKTCPNHLNLFALIINSNFCSVVFLTSPFVVISERENWFHERINIALVLKKKSHVTCEIMGGYIWRIEWDGFCHTGPILLCIDLFVFICVYFVCLHFILHSCCIIVSMVGWTWWDWSLILSTYLPSVLWHCWLVYLTRKNPSPIWPIMCLVGG